MTSVVKLLSGELVLLVAAAGLIAWPFTTYAMTRWLESFVYRIEYGWTIFALTVAGVLIVSLSMISLLVIKAAHANPVEVLKCE